MPLKTPKQQKAIKVTRNDTLTSTHHALMGCLINCTLGWAREGGRAPNLPIVGNAQTTRTIK